MDFVKNHLSVNTAVYDLNCKLIYRFNAMAPISRTNVGCSCSRNGFYLKRLDPNVDSVITVRHPSGLRSDVDGTFWDVFLN